MNNHYYTTFFFSFDYLAGVHDASDHDHVHFLHYIFNDVLLYLPLKILNINQTRKFFSPKKKSWSSNYARKKLPNYVQTVRIRIDTFYMLQNYENAQPIPQNMEQAKVSGR